MATGYVDVPHSTFAEWKANTLGNAYNLDGAYGCQCWDYASLFWRNVGFPAGYPLTSSNLSAYEIWTEQKIANAGNVFTLIYNKEDVKTGDIIVFNYDSGNPYGHIGFANEDYNGTNTISVLGQNQGGTPQPEGGENVSVNNLNLGLFLGAFRYPAWHQPVPPTPVTATNSHFKWVLYANKIRNNRNLL